MTLGESPVSTIDASNQPIDNLNAVSAASRRHDTACCFALFKSTVAPLSHSIVACNHQPEIQQ